MKLIESLFYWDVEAACFTETSVTIIVVYSGSQIAAVFETVDLY
jgi:hypothetical protein